MKLSDLSTQRERTLPYDGGCADCPRNMQGFVPATLEDTEVIVVGEAPGTTEVEKQEGFVGRTGKHLDKEFKRAGVYPYSKTNVIHCHPENDADPGHRAINCCMAQYTMDEVDGYPVVVLVGSTAIKAFFPGANPKKMRGNFLHHPDYPGQRFYCMYHPGYAVRGNRRPFRLQVQRLGRFLKEDGDKFTIYNGSGQEFLQYLDEVLEGTSTISFDLETSRLESWQPGGRIKSMAFTADGEETLFAHEDHGHFDPALERIGEWMEESGNKVIGHNVGFDIDWMEEKLDIECMAKPLDTMRLFYDLEDEIMISLKELVPKHRDGYRHMVHNPHECDDPELLRMYNSEDVIHPWHLFHDNVFDLDEDQLDLYLRVGSPSMLFFQRITSNGIWFDYEEWERAKEKLGEKRREILEDSEFNERIVGTYENPSSGASNRLRKFLYEEKDLPVLKKTQKGPATDEETIKELIDDHGYDFLQDLLDVREVDAYLTREVYPNKRDHVEDDGRIHADYKVCKTDTGRSSSANPNMQNKPRKSYIRRMFGAPDGWHFMEADYSQIELRIMLSLANQKNAIEAYNQGVDIHLQTAMQITGKGDPEAVTSEERSLAKPVNFGLTYGGDVSTVLNQAKDFGYNWSYDRGKKFYDAFFNRYDRLPHLYKKIERDWRANKGTTKTVVGHKWHYPNWNHENEYVRDKARRAAINSHGQGPASYITALTGIAAQRYIREQGWYPDIHTVNMVHDSVQLQVKDGMVPQATEALMHGRQQADNWVDDWFKVPLVLEFEMGQNWKGPGWQEYEPEELLEFS